MCRNLNCLAEQARDKKLKTFFKSVGVGITTALSMKMIHNLEFFKKNKRLSYYLGRPILGGFLLSLWYLNYFLKKKDSESRYAQDQ